MITGTVKSFDIDKGTGIVEGDDGKTYPVNHADIASMTVGSSSFRTLRTGQRVMFDTEQNTVGGIGGLQVRKAINVKPMQGNI